MSTLLEMYSYGEVVCQQLFVTDNDPGGPMVNIVKASILN